MVLHTLNSFFDVLYDERNNKYRGAKAYGQKRRTLWQGRRKKSSGDIKKVMKICKNYIEGKGKEC